MRRLLSLLSLIALSSFAGTSRYVDAPELQTKDRAAVNLNFSDIDLAFSATNKKIDKIIRNSNVVNVKDYGAVGNGTHDDTSAFNLAVAASSGKELAIPSGTYYLYGQIAIGVSSVNIVGYGLPILKQHDTNSYHFVTGTGITDVSISGIQFTSTDTTAGEGAAIELNINLGSPSNKRIKIHDCYFGPTLNMIGIGGSADDFLIYNNVFDMGSEAQHGIYVSNCNYTKIYGNRLTGPGASYPTFPASIAIKVIGSYDSVISGNNIYNWQDEGILVQHQSGTNYPRRTIISNNIINSITKTGGVGIAVSEATDTVIMGNQINGALGAGIVAGSDGLMIGQNQIIDCGTSSALVGDGIDASGSNITIVGNTMTNFVSFGIVIGAGTTGYVVIDSNMLNGNSAGRAISMPSGITAKGMVCGNSLNNCTDDYVLNGADFLIRSNRNEVGPIADN